MSLHLEDGEHDNVIQLLIQQNSSSPCDPVMDYVPEVRGTRDPSDVSSARLDQQVTRSKCPHSAPSERRRTYLLEVGSKVVLKSSTYPNKRNVVYATIQSTDPATKASGIELGAEFVLVCIDEPIPENEELVREVCECDRETICDAFVEGLLIAWPSVNMKAR